MIDAGADIMMICLTRPYNTRMPIEENKPARLPAGAPLAGPNGASKQACTARCRQVE